MNKTLKDLYEDALLATRAKAKELHCMVKPYLYEAHNWFVIYLCVDMFGGTACGVKWYEGKWYLDIFKECVEYKDVDEVLKHVKPYVDHEFQVRDLDAVYDMVNSQY